MSIYYSRGGRIKLSATKMINILIQKRPSVGAATMARACQSMDKRMYSTKNGARKHKILSRTPLSIIYKRLFARVMRAVGETRTLDLRITSAPLYRLSYNGNLTDPKYTKMA
jgi:hypothetical protein